MSTNDNMERVDFIVRNKLVMNSMIPEGAKFILDNLYYFGFKAYLVGGCVRDVLLDRIPNDWDICTSATTDELMAFVSCINENMRKENKLKIVPTGLKHGTVTIIVDGEAYEITTFRNDGIYSDNRRPDTVKFTRDLIEDLKRRDFTMNAIAFSSVEGFIDPYNGIDDIKNKIIRCVGNPYDRFNEDYLRILRAIRFASQIDDFYIENNTSEAVIELMHKITNISMERINNEMCKILSSDNPHYFMDSNIVCNIIPEFEYCLDFPQNNPYHKYDVYEHTEVALKSDKSNDLIVRLALLFHDIGKPHCYQDDEDGTRHFRGHGKVSSDLTNTIMRNLKFDNDTREKVVELVHYHDATIEVGKKYVRRWLNILGEEQFERLLQVRAADIKAQSGIDEFERLEKINNIKNLLNEVLDENECFSLKDLSINGRDLIDMGIPEGKTIGVILKQLLLMVMDGKVKNEKEELIRIIEEDIIKDIDKLFIN